MNPLIRTLIDSLEDPSVAFEPGELMHLELAARQRRSIEQQRVLRHHQDLQLHCERPAKVAV